MNEVPTLELTDTELPGALKVNQYLLALRKASAEAHDSPYYTTLVFLTEDIAEAIETALDEARV